MSTETLNILFLPKWYPHDADPFDGNFIENHAHAIKRVCNLSVAFVHSEDRQKGDLYRLEEKDNEGIREVRVYFKRASSPIGPINRIINLKRYAKAQEIAYSKLYPIHAPDLVHVHVLARSAFLALKLLKEGIPFVITEHWSGYLAESAALKKSGKAFFYKIIGNRAKAIHTVTQHLANAMQSHGIASNYTVIPNVVKEDLFQPSKKNISDKIKILFVGNILQHPKRILDIIDVFSEIAKERQDFQLAIYGEGNDLGKMQKKIEELNLSNLIHYQGTRNREGIAEIMAKSDFLFLYSEFENQPCVINEALCSGISVVVPNIEGIVEFMEDDFGIIFQRLEQGEFKSSLIRMMNEYQNFNSEKIRSIAVEKFGEEAISKEFLKFYQNALSQ